MYARNADVILTRTNPATANKCGKEVMNMDDAAREARNKYKRDWYRRNREKQREYERRYWERKADSYKKKTEEIGKDGK